ncbi:MAG TPA: hypothetical protein VI731_00945 [Bacteroidia bacterium]|nr:hypothetical protein [Bacteroidia bacterium]
MNFPMQNFRLFTLLLSFTTALLFISCQPEEEPIPADPRDTYVDQWTCNENSTVAGQVNPYTVHINKSTTSSSQVLIENFYNLGFGVKATATISGNSITLATQSLATYQMHGSGSKTGSNTLSMTYYVDDGNEIDTCVSTFTRQ